MDFSIAHLLSYDYEFLNNTRISPIKGFIKFFIFEEFRSLLLGVLIEFSSPFLVVCWLILMLIYTKTSKH